MIIRVDVLGITIYWKTCFYSTVRVHDHVSIYKKFFNFLYQSSLQYEIWKVLKIIRMEKKQTPYYKHFFNIKVPCKLILLQMDISKIKIFHDLSNWKVVTFYLVWWPLYRVHKVHHDRPPYRNACHSSAASHKH